MAQPRIDEVSTNANIFKLKLGLIQMTRDSALEDIH